MPKIIEALRERLLEEARRQLLSEGDVNVRGLAQSCHIAVGTVYNYYAGKEDLMAYVMLQDWHALLNRAQARSAAADPIAALGHVYAALREFTELYIASWRAYTRSGTNGQEQIKMHHQQLVEQMAAVIAPALERAGALWHPGLPAFLAEVLLVSVTRGEENFREIEPMLRRLTSPQ